MEKTSSIMISLSKIKKKNIPEVCAVTTLSLFQLSGL